MELTRAGIVSRHLEELVSAYWHDVDFNWGCNAAAHYTHNGVFAAGETRYEGRDEIREFYAWRRERGARVNVHLVGNFHLHRLIGDEAEVHWICTLFASDGEAPQASASPVTISRVEDLFVQVSDNVWLCRQRHWHALFRSGIATTRLSRDELAGRIARRSPNRND